MQLTRTNSELENYTTLKVISTSHHLISPWVGSQHSLAHCFCRRRRRRRRRMVSMKQICSVLVLMCQLSQMLDIGEMANEPPIYFSFYLGFFLHWITFVTKIMKMKSISSTFGTSLINFNHSQLRGRVFAGVRVRFSVVAILKYDKRYCRTCFTYWPRVHQMSRL